MHLPPSYSYNSLFRDAVEPYHNEVDNYKRKSTSKINESNKKFKDKSTEIQQHQNQEKEIKHDEAPGRFISLTLIALMRRIFLLAFLLLHTTVSNFN